MYKLVNIRTGKVYALDKSRKILQGYGRFIKYKGYISRNTRMKIIRNTGWFLPKGIHYFYKI